MNSIEDISSLAELINLTDVSLHNNAITDVSALEEHVNLKKLDLSGNPIDDSAVEVLCTLTGLEKLDLQRTGISQEGHCSNPCRIAEGERACLRLSNSCLLRLRTVSIEKTETD